MPIGDTTVTEVTMTTAQEDQKACEMVREGCLDLIRRAQQIVNQANQAITDAPGDKAAVMGLFGADQTDAEALMQKVVTLVNDHQQTGSPAVSF